MIKLRGHHLICLQFFRGQGYDPVFLEKLREVMKRAATEPVEVAEGPDELCRACPYLQKEQCTHPETSEAEIREMDRTALEILNLAPGSRLKWPEETRTPLREGFGRWVWEFCQECSWRPVCEPDPDFQALKRKSSESVKT